MKNAALDHSRASTLMRQPGQPPNCSNDQPSRNAENCTLYNWVNIQRDANSNNNPGCKNHYHFRKSHIQHGSNCGGTVTAQFRT